VVFGTRLREQRQSAGLSLRQLAARVGYDHSYLSQVERGQRPGSAELARHCDRELGTGSRLLTAFEQQTRPRPVPRPVPPLTGALDPLTTIWHELTRELPSTVDDLHHLPPSRRLPELVIELQTRRTDDQLTAQLSVLVAETLTASGDATQARRWWWAARKLADGTGLQGIVRAREALSGLAERRPLPQLLTITDEAVSSAQQAPEAAVQALTARALILADLGRADEARADLQQLVGAADEAIHATPQPTTWSEHQLRWAEGRICARLGYGSAACVLLDRARDLCPPERLGERARLDMTIAEALAVEGELPAALAYALRTLVELPDEWHDRYLYDDAQRVHTAVQEQDPYAPALGRLAYLIGRSMGSGSKPG
jgi:transcriptional regulator with XRE-family HTH domain